MNLYEKPCIGMAKVIVAGKRSAALNEAKSIKNTSKNSHNFLEISPVQRNHLLYINCKAMHMSKEDNPSQRNCQKVCVT